MSYLMLFPSLVWHTIREISKLWQNSHSLKFMYYRGWYPGTNIGFRRVPDNDGWRVAGCVPQ